MVDCYFMMENKLANFYTITYLVNRDITVIEYSFNKRLDSYYYSSLQTWTAIACFISVKFGFFAPLQKTYNRNIATGIFIFCEALFLPTIVFMGIGVALGRILKQYVKKYLRSPATPESAHSSGGSNEEN